MALKSKPLEQLRLDIPTNAAAQGELVRVNLNVSESTRTAWKMLALHRKVTLQDLIIEAMIKYTKE